MTSCHMQQRQTVKYDSLCLTSRVCLYCFLEDMHNTDVVCT